jgi:hypothetical protein
MSTRVSLIIVAAVLALQLFPLDRSNPPVGVEVDAPPEVKAVLERACYNCHSHQTVWPWYAWVAPVSFLITHDVHEAREHLNFSDWGQYSPEKARKKIDEILEEVEEGEMPLFYFLPLHPEAELTAEDRLAIEAWVTSVNEGS